MKHNQFAEITKKASKTFYTAALFFPKESRDDVFVLYSFVRIADDYIDSTPPNTKAFTAYVKETLRAFDGEKEATNTIIYAFIKLAKRKRIPRQLIVDYFEGQENALKHSSYNTYAELEKFIYGVAEVIGLMMCYVLDIPKAAHASAQKLGRAMQLVNILRDIDEDYAMGKIYLPLNELEKFGLPAYIDETAAQKQKKAYLLFMDFQTKRIVRLLAEAEKGFHFIPKKQLLPIKTSARLYGSLTKRFARDPYIMFRKKVKPGIAEIARTLLIARFT